MYDPILITVSIIFLPFLLLFFKKIQKNVYLTKTQKLTRGFYFEFLNGEANLFVYTVVSCYS